MIRIGSEMLTDVDWSDQIRPFQQSILLQMMQGRQLYTFGDQHQLQFELQLRESIVKAAGDLYRSGVQYAVFEDSRCNPRYWILTPQGGFRLRPDVRSSAAITDIYQNGHLYAFECATAMVIVLYKAVLDVLDPNVFDRLFDHLLLWAWQYDQDLGLTTKKRFEYLPGDIVYFKNPDVNPATPEWQGENAVIMGGGLYYGHGIGITTAEAIIMALNANRRPGATRSAYLMDQATRPNFRYLSQFARPVRIYVQRIGNAVYRWTDAHF